jgi:hypothetical protein
LIDGRRKMTARWKRASPPSATNISETERLAYSIQESADLLGVDYFSIYRLIQRGNL